MDELNRHRSFTDTESHPLYRAVTHITHGKDAGNIGLEQERITVERPAFWMLPVTYKIGAGQQESALVPLNDTRQPIRPRQRPNEYKHCTRRYALNLAGVRTKYRDLFQMRLPVRLGYGGMRPKLNVRCFLNLIDQVS